MPASFRSSVFGRSLSTTPAFLPGTQNHAEFQISIGKQMPFATWGAFSFCDYVNELMNDKRDGRRQLPGGCHDGAVQAYAAARQGIPSFILKITDIWTLTNKNLSRLYWSECCWVRPGITWSSGRGALMHIAKRLATRKQVVRRHKYFLVCEECHTRNAFQMAR